MRPLPRAVAAAVLLAAACTDPRAHARAVCVLVDVSGTYADQRREVVRIVKSGLLPRMRPGDTFVLIRVGDRGYTKDSVVATATLDDQPSHANAQKMELAAKLERFAAMDLHERHTDLSGAILLAAEYLRASHAGRKSIVVFSDMLEELPRGAQRSLEPGELAGVDVVAMNVKRLAADQMDPAAYRRRLDGWGTRLTTARAASWTVVLDPTELAARLEEP